MKYTYSQNRLSAREVHKFADRNAAHNADVVDAEVTEGIALLQVGMREKRADGEQPRHP